VQLDRIPLPSAADDPISGTASGLTGVSLVDRPADLDGSSATIAVSRRPGARRGLILVALACLSLLGQGEPSRVDARFISPSATLQTYWEALRMGDSYGAGECLVESRRGLPRPGMLWFLPPTDELTLEGFRMLPVTAGRVLVSYEVRYRPSGTREVRSFFTADELVRKRGTWRITLPAGEVDMPEWEPVRRPVDI